MDDLQFYILFNRISVISEWLTGDIEKTVCNWTQFTTEKISVLGWAPTLDR